MRPFNPGSATVDCKMLAGWKRSTILMQDIVQSTVFSHIIIEHEHVLTLAEPVCVWLRVYMCICSCVEKTEPPRSSS